MDFDDVSVNGSIANVEDDTDEDMGINSFESDDYAESDEDDTADE